MGLGIRGRRSGLFHLRLAGGLVQNKVVRNKLVQNDCDRLAEIHRGVFGSGGNAEQKLAMTEILIG